MSLRSASSTNSTAGVSYNCGDCGSEVILRPGDVVICRECGYRILYKKRTKQVRGEVKLGLPCIR